MRNSIKEQIEGIEGQIEALDYNHMLDEYTDNVYHCSGRYSEYCGKRQSLEMQLKELKSFQDTQKQVAA